MDIFRQNNVHGRSRNMLVTVSVWLVSDPRRVVGRQDIYGLIEQLELYLLVYDTT